MMLSKRSELIPPFLVMEVLEKAHEFEKAGKNIIHLEVGEPDFSTPECVVGACIRAIKEGETNYTHSLGLLELREAISREYLERYGVTVSPDQVIVTSGSSPAIFLTLSVLLNPQDEVIVSNPCYACYPNFIRFLDGKPIEIDVNENDGFQYHSGEIEKKITGKTIAVLINSPSNPTGHILSKERMEEIADLGSYVVSDEIYHALVYEGNAHSILEFTDKAFVISGFSKAYAMTGWRLGYAIVPPEFIRPMQKIQQNFFISANSFVQWAGVVALQEAREDVKKMRDIFDSRRKFIIKRLKEIGFGIAVDPTGAFYVLANAKKFTFDSYGFSSDLLLRAGVGVTPGIDFGSNGEGYLRFSYANSVENIAEGMDRIEKYLTKQ